MIVDIEKLCKELHEKVGIDKTVRIIIQDGDPSEEIESWITQHTLNIDNISPFSKISVSKGTQWSYISKNKLNN